MSSVTGISCNTEAVMARYRALKGQGMDGLTASRVVRFGFVGDIPDPMLDVPTRADVPVGMSPVVGVSPLCPQCKRRPIEAGRGQCSACRKKAYRGRTEAPKGG